MVTVGQALTGPETGWKRYDDTQLYYVGEWVNDYVCSPSYDGSYSYVKSPSYVGEEHSCRFNFVGDKLRLIGVLERTYTTDAVISIDGEKYKFYQEGSQVFQVINFEITFPSVKERSVIIYNNDPNGFFLVDAIDINDNGTIKPYNPTSTAVIPAPTNLSATAGDAKVNLNWSAVTGATGYNVKRSTTAGGTYATIVSNVSGTSYVDTAVTNGTTYYYVVTAITASGESGNSNEASATPQAAVTPPNTGNQLLRVTVIDSSDHDYQLSSAEIEAFVNWFMKHASTDTAGYLLTKKTGTQNSKEYLAFDKIISFEVIPVA